jgi:hypothetical protein
MRTFEDHSACTKYHSFRDQSYAAYRSARRLRPRRDHIERLAPHLYQVLVVFRCGSCTCLRFLSSLIFSQDTLDLYDYLCHLLVAVADMICRPTAGLRREGFVFGHVAWREIRLVVDVAAVAQTAAA